MSFTPGEVISRKDGTAFPDGKIFAVVRRDNMGEYSGYFGNLRVFIEGGQWVPTEDVRIATARELLEESAKSNPKDPGIDWEGRYKEELARRRKAQHKARRANDSIQPMIEELAAAKRRLREIERGRQMREIRCDQAIVHTRKLALIRNIIDDEFFEQKGW